MQINKSLIFILALLLAFISVDAQDEFVSTIDNDKNIIFNGTYQADTILKIKIYNDKHKDDVYFAFIKTDENGAYSLTKQDVELQKIKDGELTFEISTNEEQKSVEVESKKMLLDKGLTLKFSSKAYGEYLGDGIVNSYEVSDYMIEGETELNVKDITITITDEKNTTIRYTLGDLILDEDGFFKIEHIDLSHLKDGNITIVADGVDIAGNMSSVRENILKDTVVKPPVLLKKIKNNNLSNVVNRKILVASGTSEPFAKIYFTFTQNDVVIKESVLADKNGAWELLGGDLDISVFKNERVYVEIYQEDVAKNKSEAFKYFNEKFKRPIFPLSPLPIDPQKYQLIYTIDENNDEIKDIFITKKNIYVATYGAIRVWGKSYAKLQREVEVPEVWVNDLVVVEERVFAALGNGEVRVYNKNTLELLRTIKVDDLAILRIAVDKDKLITSSAKGVVKIYDAQSYKHLHTLKNHQWDVGAIVVYGDKLYSGSDDYSIKVWDLKSYKLLKTIKSAHSGTINDLLIYDGMLISASDDKTIVIRELKTLEILRVLKAHKKGVNRLKVTNNFLISVSSDRNMILWDMYSGEIYKKIKAHSKKIDALDVNDFNIVTGSRDYKIKIWGYDDSVESLDSEDETAKPKYALLKSFAIKSGSPTSLSQNESDIILSSDNGYIFFYNKITHDYVKEYSTLDEIQKPHNANDDEDMNDEEEDAVEFTPKLQKIYDTANYGNKLLASLQDSSIKVWDMEKDKAISLLTGNELAVVDIKISSVYILGASMSGAISVYDIESGEFVNLIEGHQYNVNTIALYEDDKVVSGGDDYSIKIRDIESGDLILDIKEAHEDIITKVLVYENYLISASLDGTIKVRDIQSGKLLKILYSHKKGVTTMALDDENLITASNDNTLKVWSLKDFSLITTMDKHTGGVVDIMITDDYLISIAKDKTMKVWKYYE